MNTVNAIIDLRREGIPEKYYGKTFEYFSFEMFNNEPANLFLVQVMDDGRKEAIVITGLNEMPVPYQDFVEFLKTIKIDNSNPRYPVSMDLKVARELYKVDIPVTSEIKPASFKYIDCPVCHQQLIPLEPFDEEGVYDFWCDACDIDIQVTVNSEIKGD